KSTRRSVPVETSASTALISCDVLGGWLLLSSIKVNAASSRVTTTDRVTTARWIKTEIA
nr:hypothetical protein [Tanacetum cinerariifolium]